MENLEELLVIYQSIGSPQGETHNSTSPQLRVTIQG